MKTSLTTSVLLVGAITVTSAAFAMGGSDTMMSGHDMMMNGSTQGNMHADTGNTMSASMMNGSGSMMNSMHETMTTGSGNTMMSGGMMNMQGSHSAMMGKKLSQQETTFIQEKLKSIGKNQSRLDAILAKIDTLLSGSARESIKQKLQEIKDLIIESKVQ